MKKSTKILTTVSAVVVLLAGYTIYTIARPFVLHTELDIDASPAQVWNVLTDRQSYPEWNPFIVSSTGELIKGKTITNVLRDTKGDETKFTPTLLAVSRTRSSAGSARSRPAGSSTANTPSGSSRSRTAAPD